MAQIQAAVERRGGLYARYVTARKQSALGLTSVLRAEEGWTAQVGFGSGFKCNSVVWKAIRNIHDTEHAEWAHMKNPANIDRCWNYIQVRCFFIASAWLRYSQHFRRPADLARLCCGREHAQQGSSQCTLLMEVCMVTPVKEPDAGPLI